MPDSMGRRDVEFWGSAYGGIDRGMGLEKGRKTVDLSSEIA
jgi:hypothetical protein